jgi:hypothetical protein
MDILMPDKINGQPASMLKNVRQVTLIGANGSGKTRFANWLVEKYKDKAFRVSALKALFPSNVTNELEGSIDLQYEGSKYFSHLMLMTTTTNVGEVQKDILEYINKIKVEDVDKDLFEIVKRKKIGETILSADSLNIAYRRIIDGILYDTNTYIDVEILEKLTPEDIKEFLNNLREDNQVISKILPKE